MWPNYQIIGATIIDVNNLLDVRAAKMAKNICLKVLAIRIYLLTC